ncbi:MAG: hypothetical protein Q4E91_09845 [Lachnospiraceae bacterium]|nr:hypothetical protein [Lachnospiraceae bacterium]
MNDSYDYFYENPQDFHSKPDSDPSRQKPSGSPALATAAFVLCLIGGISFFICYISIPLAALAIILALLSRGDGKISVRGKIAVVISVLDIFISVFFTASAVYSVLNDPVQRRQFEALWNYYMDYYSNDSDSGTLQDYLDYYNHHPGLDSDQYEGSEDERNEFIQDFDGQEFVFLENGMDFAAWTWERKGGVSV